MAAAGCLEPIQGSNSSLQRVWLAAHDSAQEGVSRWRGSLQVWRDWYSDQLVSHLPWDTGRPYDGGVKYNCMVVMASVEQTAGQSAATSRPVIIDECGINFCTVCR